MENFWKTIALVLISVILCIAVGRQAKEFSVILAMLVFCIAALTAVSYLEPVFSLLSHLASMGNTQNDVLGILLKACGIALVSEFAGMVCADAGNNSLAKAVQLLGSTAILYITIPLVQMFLNLLQNLLGNV